jgi:hypothetical protein
MELRTTVLGQKRKREHDDTITQARPAIPFCFPCRKKATQPPPHDFFFCRLCVSCPNVSFTLWFRTRILGTRSTLTRPNPDQSLQIIYVWTSLTCSLLDPAGLSHNYNRPLPFLEIGCDSGCLPSRSARLHSTTVCRITP